MIDCLRKSLRAFSTAHSPARLARIATGLACLMVCCGGWPGGSARAAEAFAEASAEASHTLRYRRIYAPADHIDQLRSGERYLPIEAAEFSRLTELANLMVSQSGGSPAPSTVRPYLKQANYEARLVGNQFVDGTATLTIVDHARHTSLLPLAPCSLAISRPFWDHQPSEPATLGFSTSAAVGVVVEPFPDGQEGTLRFDWSLRGKRDAADALTFDFQFPACPMKRLTLSLPEAMVPRPEVGLVTGSQPSDAGWRKWQIELGGHDRSIVRVAARTTTGEQRPSVLVRQVLTYDLSPRGLELTAQFTLDVPAQATALDPLRQITLTMDPTLRLAAAHFGEVEVPWSISTNHITGRTRVVLVLPEPLQGTGRVLYLTAVGKTVTDRLWRLPDIRPEGMFWVEGTARLLVPEALVLERLISVGCRQTGTEPLSAPRLGEAIELQYFSPTAAPEIHITRRKARLSMHTATTLQLDSDEVSGRLVADCEVTGPALFSIQAHVPPPWTIDSVTSVPTGAIGDWDLSPAAEGDRRLTIPLAKALAANAPLRLVIVGHWRRSALVGELAYDELQMVRFEPAETSRPLVLVRTTDPFQLDVSGDATLTYLDPTELDPRESERFDRPSEGLLFVDDGQAERLRISLHRQSPRYTGQIDVAATVTGGSLVETYRIVCIPESARVERVLVHFSQTSASALRWTAETDVGQPLSARRLTAAQQQRAGQGTGGETWEVTLRRPQNERFALQAVRTTPFESQQAVNLASLPQATEQRGRVTVRSLGRQAPQVVNRRLEPIPAEPPSPDRFSAVRATFQYDPARDTMAAAEPPLALAPHQDDATGPTLAWVWNLDVRSKCMPSGTSEHYATLRIQNEGLPRMQLSIPAGARLLAVWVDGHEVPLAAGHGHSEPFVVKLPPDRKFPVVLVHYLTSDSPLGIFNSVRARLPHVDLPVVAEQWTLWVPPGYEAPDVSASPAGARRSWSQRLFGPLGRSRGSRLFNPLRADDWTGLLRRATLDHAGQAFGSPANTSTKDTSPGATDLSASPWKSTGPPPADVTGWSAYRIEGSTAASGAIRVVRVRAVRMLGLTVFLLATALGCWRLAGRPIAVVVVLGLAGAAALVVPLAYVPLATGVFLGVLASLAIRLTLRQPESPTPAQNAAESSPSTTKLTASLTGASRTIVLLPVMLGLTAAAWHVCAAEPAAGQKPPTPLPLRQPAAPLAARIQKVFIPIDADRKPTGSRYYVSEAFYRELYRRAAVVQQTPGAWVITRATYRGNLVRELQPARAAGRPPARLVVGQLKAVFDLQVLARNAEVRLPIARGDAEWLPYQARLDGRPITWRWDAEPSALVVEIEEPGRYRLELPVQPTLQNDDNTMGFELGTVPVADSRIELALPSDAPAITFSTAKGAITPGDRRGLLDAELGATDRLVVRWPRTAPDTNVETETDVEELFWLHIGPGRVMLNARFHVQVSKGRVSQLRLLADPRLRLQPFGEDSPIESHRVVPGDPQTILLQLGAPVDEQVTIDARMLLTGSSGIGSLRLPRLQMLATRTSRRLLAVSIDPALQYDEDAEQQLESLSVPDFVTAWGEVDAEPSFAHQLPVANPTWNVATQPRQVDKKTDQTLVLNIRRDEMELHFKADITTEAGYEFQYRLSAPRDLEVKSVSVRDKEGVERAARWSREPEGTITIFLTGPVAGRSHLELLGTLSTVPAGRYPLPRINVERGEIGKNLTYVFRHPAVLVSIEDIKGLKPLEETTPALPAPALGRLVGRYAIEEQPATATLVVAPNEPQVSGVAVTSLHHEDDTWEATLDYHFRASQGVVDTVRLDTPSWWNGPYQVEPAATVTTVDIPGKQRRQVIVRPPEAISGEYHLQIRAPLSFAEIQRPRAPNIMPLAVDQLTRFLVLPTGAKNQRITWETRGMRQAELPEDFSRPLAAPDTWQAYHLFGQSPQAQLKSVRQEKATPQIRLADIRVEVAADRTCLGVATFDLEPAGLASCQLHLQDGYRLVQATVAGLSAWPQAIGKGRWQLELGPRNLPQRIEIVFASQARGGIWPWSLDELHAPRLLAGGRDIENRDRRVEDMDVERTLWTVYSPAFAGTAVPTGTKPTTALRQGLARLRTTASLVDLGADVVAEQGADEIARWYGTWARRFLRSSRAIVAQAAGARRSREAKLEVEATVAEQPAVAERLGTTTVWSKLSNETPPAAEPAELWLQHLGQDTIAARCIFPGRESSLHLRFDNSPEADLPWRFAAALLLGIAAGAVVVALGSGMPSDIFRRWPHALGLAGGLFWWLWLAPSVGGWIVIALTLVTLVRRKE